MDEIPSVDTWRDARYRAGLLDVTRIGAHEEYPGGGADRAEARHQRAALHSGHPRIGHQEVDATERHDLESTPGLGGFEHGVSVLLEDLGRPGADIRLVGNDEHRVPRRALSLVFEIGLGDPGVDPLQS